MARLKGRESIFEDPDEKAVRDYDPEATGHGHGESSGSESQDDHAGTEHYVAVGKSKLREKEGVSLGKNYRGSRISRQALEEESEQESEEDDEDEEGFDDPENADLEADTAQANDSEIESDDALGESDVEGLKDFVFRGSSKPKTSRKRATAADYMSSSDEDGEDAAGGAELSDEEGEDVDGSSEDEDMDDGLDALVDGGDTSQGESDDDDDEDEDEDEEEEEEEDGKQDAKPSLPTTSNQSEVQKGIAIQEQRKIYDGLLNIRIRLQKALIASNTFPTLEETSPSSESEAYEAAEEAAIKLLNTMSGLRQNLTPASAVGEKRKREIEVGASTAEIWERIQEEDRDAVRFREDRLEKWSRKVQSVNVATAKLGAKQKTLIGSLQEQLITPQSRLVKRTQVPRSCAPVQAAQKMTESEAIFDDADFYQLLLKELVDQRTVESAAEQNGAVASVMVTASKEAKMRKVVDRKASKGRKMRFTVHEKLQNFMAPEDRRSWEQEAIDRLFGTLLGQKLELNEDENEDEDDEMDELYNNAAGGPRLFR